MGVRVHTSAYTAHRLTMAGKLWFTGKSRSKMSFENLNSLWGGVTVLTAALERRVPGVSDLVVVAGEGWPLQTDSGYARKTLVCKQWAFEKWPKYWQILLETHIRGPLPLLVFTWPGRVPEVGGLVGVRVNTSAYTAHRVAMAGKLWFWCMKAWRSLKFGQIRPPTTELASLEHLKKTTLDFKW